jgi:hypothetical protein
MAEQETVSIDLDDLELGEIEEFEELMGRSLGEVDLQSGKAMVHLIWIAKRREDPDYTLDDARKIKLSQLTGEEDEPDPTPAASKPVAGGRRSAGKKQA